MLMPALPPVQYIRQSEQVASFPGLLLFRLHEGKSQGLVSKVTCGQRVEGTFSAKAIIERR